jgi:archaellum component FlaC
MTGHNFFMHINSTNLPGYFACACLKPAKYFQNRLDDVQKTCEDVILLSTKRYAKEADCSLEVVLTNQEKDCLIPINSKKNVFILNNAIPVSRVYKIYFKSDNTRDKIITLVNLSSAFIPESMVSFIVDNDTTNYSEIELPKDFLIQDLTYNIKKFDSLLGGFAIMRLAGEEYMNYSDNYFSTLSYFNSVVESELLNAKKNINDIYWDAFVGNSSFKNLFPYINKVLTSDDLIVITNQEGQRIQKNPLSGIIDINSLERGAYVVAVLYSYGMSDEGRKNKIDGLILNNFKKDLRPDKSEVIALCYGLNRGYSVFSNKYKTTSTEKVVKFELNSQMDYYTIEALYQYSFNGTKKSGEFPYLNSWCPKYPKLKRKLKKSEYVILDKVIFGEVIKVGSSKWWSGIMQSFFSKNGEELFKPFMQKVFDKIKSDIELDYQEVISEKDETISDLKTDNSKLRSKTFEVQSLQTQVENLKKEIKALKSKSSAVAESVTEYSTNTKSDSYFAELQKKVDDLQKLIKEVNKQTKMAVTKDMIKKFYELSTPENPIVFPDK